MTKIGLLGAQGRMGREVAAMIAASFQERATLHASADRDQPLESLLGCDVVIDFSSPEAVLQLGERLSAAADPLPALIIGSTGWNLETRPAVRKLAERTSVILSSNFSQGVLLMQEMLREYAPLFEQFGYTPVIVETHHRHKKDSPSGTAISLQRVISPAGPGNVQTHAIRAGEVVGDHEVTFHGTADRISITHSAQNRSIFARGAIEAAIWLAARRMGPNPLRGLLGMDAYFTAVRGRLAEQSKEKRGTKP